MFDVTLVSSDQKQVSAHRLVLSACSDVFKNIFNNNNSHSHPLLYLDGLDSGDINLILDYIYQGEVQIYQEHLDRFLDIAKKFKLDGLMAEDSVDQKDSKFGNSFKHLEEFQEEYIKDHVAPAPTMKVKERSLKIFSETHEASNSEVEEKFLELVVKENNIYRCTVCEKTQSHRTKMRLHLETHLTGLSYDCPTCGKNFRFKNSLNRHISDKHNKV